MGSVGAWFDVRPGQAKLDDHYTHQYIRRTERRPQSFLRHHPSLASPRLALPCLALPCLALAFAPPPPSLAPASPLPPPPSLLPRLRPLLTSEPRANLCTKAEELAPCFASFFCAHGVASLGVVVASGDASLGCAAGQVLFLVARFGVSCCCLRRGGDVAFSSC
jgi:hypothetical protein